MRIRASRKGIRPRSQHKTAALGVGADEFIHRRLHPGPALGATAFVQAIEQHQGTVTQCQTLQEVRILRQQTNPALAQLTADKRPKITRTRGLFPNGQLIGEGAQHHANREQRASSPGVAQMRKFGGIAAPRLGQGQQHARAKAAFSTAGVAKQGEFGMYGQRFQHRNRASRAL